MFYNRDSKEITQEEYLELAVQEDYRRVDVTHYEIDGEKVRVSTVWLGMDYGFGGNKIIFETMVFGGRLDGQFERYATELQAVLGHGAMCEKVKKEG